MGLFDALRSLLARADAEIDGIGAARLPMAFAKFYPGGLPAFLDRLREAGHGAAVESWLGSGANTILQPDVYAALLPPAVAARFATDLGIPVSRVPMALAAFLPAAVDRQSSDGTLAPQMQFSTQEAQTQEPQISEPQARETQVHEARMQDTRLMA